MGEKATHDKDVQYSWQAPRDRSLRASDADRTAVGDILRKAHVEGRLDPEEFAERYGRCLEAKTYSELDALLSDLPVKDASPAPAWPASSPWGDQRGPWRYGPQPPPSTNRGWHWGPVWALGPLAWLTVLFAIIEAFALGSGHFLWIFFPLLFFYWVGPRRQRMKRRQRGCDSWRS